MVGGDHLQCCYREQLSYALYSKFREPRLYSMVVTGDWDLIPARCKSHPKEASFTHKYPPHDTALSRLLRSTAGCSLPAVDATAAATAATQQGGMDAELVHQMNQLKLNAVVALLEANRLAAVTLDSFGRTPLHLACMDATTDDGAIASAILEINPAAAAIMDTAELRTPLHFLVARSEPRIPAALLRQLVHQHAAAVFRQDIVGDTVLDIVQQRADELENAPEILSVLQQVPDQRRESVVRGGHTSPLKQQLQDGTTPPVGSVGRAE